MAVPTAQAALVVHAERRDPVERLASLFDAHADRLYRLARRLTSSAEDARDLVQETFLRATRSSKSIPLGQADEEAWLVRVLINLQRDQWRRHALRANHDARNFRNKPVRVEPDQESSLVVRATVWQALQTLPPRRRAILIMHELEGLEMRAIASMLRITPVTVRWHLSRGRRDLASLLKVTGRA